MAIQQLTLGVGASKKTYLDDVFSTFLYEGNADDSGSSSQSINNGINLSGEGGMTWIKWRGGTYSHSLFDTVRGNTKRLSSEDSGAENTWTDAITSFNNNGFTLGSSAQVNYENLDFASWTFRKAPGFFDVVTYTGNGSNRTIAHSLGSIPGMIIIKRTDTTSNWAVYHRDFNGGVNPEQYVVFLDTTDAEASHAASWNNSPPTSSVFHVGTHARVNGNGGTFVAYVFAGGESTAATARSVEFDGSNDYVTVPASSDYDFGSGDFTVEGWIYAESLSGQRGIVDNWDYTNNQRSWMLRMNGSALQFYVSTDGSSGTVIGFDIEKEANKQWVHFAGVRTGNTLKLFINGLEVEGSASISGSLFAGDTDPIHIGSMHGANYFDGKISNVRIVKGTAVYTSSFRPPTEPLTNITNTKLLCCNNSSVTGATVSSGTLTNNGATASTDSPFDDPAAFTFGDSKEGIVKCGSYVGNGNDDGPEINLGWEPQWILLKNESNTAHWLVMDNMRGMVHGAGDVVLYPNLNNAEGTGFTRIDLLSNGFKITEDDSKLNTNGDTYIYMAIRRPDGYVGKLAEAGTDVFAMAAGTSNSDIPTFVSGFPVDFSLYRNPTATDSWSANSRLLGTKRVYTNTNAAESTNSDITWDFQNGFYKDTGDVSDYQAWMWKRHAGMDVVTWSGTNSSVVRRHNLGKTPEMIWFKSRSSTRNWRVYHIGLNGGTNPEDYAINLNQDDPESSNTNYMTSTAPTATHFVSGNDDDTNGSGKTYIAMLFASVEGISKVGSYDGTGSAQTITTGFQPRFAIIRRVDGSEDHWVVLDTTRGWGSGDDKGLKLNATSAQGTTEDYGAPTSTGFSLTSNGWVNYNTGNYIYYAHA